MANYNITMTKPKVTIHCKDKTMEDDLVIIAPVIEEWDGSYEEISSGYTLILNCNNYILNNSNYQYSLDSGATWNQFTSESITLENVTNIQFKTGSYGSTTLGGIGYHLYIGTTEYGVDIADIIAETASVDVTADATWYVIGEYNNGGSSD